MMRFNVRVYGILIDNGAVLVSDEYIKKNCITKFPGGGLEFGEGTRDCVIREFKEELGIDVETTDHFYTTDFYVSSAFDTNSQVISIYYLVKALSDPKITTSNKAHDYEKKEGSQSFRWISLKKMKENDFTLIIDIKVAEMLIKLYGNG
jgi:8-oxo-dGTP diphosphatase